MKARSGIVAAAFILVGCQYDPFAHEFTKAEPRESAIVGRYFPDRETTDRLRSSLGVNVSNHAALAINADHTFLATEIPNCWSERTFDCAGGTETWHGTWSIRHNQEWWAVELHITFRNGRATSFGLPAMLRREQPPYLIHLIIGDPDSGDALAFEQR